MNFHQIKTIEEVLSEIAAYLESVLSWVFFDKLLTFWYSKIEKCSCHLLKIVSSKSVIRKYLVKQTLVRLKRADLSEVKGHAGKCFSILLCFT